MITKSSVRSDATIDLVTDSASMVIDEVIKQEEEDDSDDNWPMVETEPETETTTETESTEGE